jgi:hypothetical protein
MCKHNVFAQIHMLNKNILHFCNRAIGLVLDFIHRLVCERQKYHNVSETGSVSILRWMGQDKPTQLGPLERASLKSLDKPWSVKKNNL